MINSKPKEVAELEDSVEDFLTYRKYSLDARKRELLQQVQNGCDGKVQPVGPAGPTPTPVFR